MSNIKKPRRRRLVMLLCVTFLFCSLLSSAAFAAGVTVSTAYSDSYFQTFSSKGTWVGIGTPKHYIVETGEVCYCVQTDKTEPTNAGYTEVDGEQVFNTPAVLRASRSSLKTATPRLRTASLCQRRHSRSRRHRGACGKRHGLYRERQCKR